MLTFSEVSFEDLERNWICCRLFFLEKLLNAEVHTTQELNLLVILPDLSRERPRVRRHLNVKIQN